MAAGVPNREDFAYELPPGLIAAEPADSRGASRLLRATRHGDLLGESAFADLPALLDPGDLLVVNDSRVLPARLFARRPVDGEAGGGRVELLLVRPLEGGGWLAMARPARRLRPGGRLRIGEREIEIVERRDDGEVVLRPVGGDLIDLARDHGEMPLPPYIAKRRESLPERDYGTLDRERYQTVYARETGSVAAPTAGLHFDRPLLARLDERGVRRAPVTLHVGPGTFRPPSDRDLARRRLHAEVFTLPAATMAAIRETRVRGGRVVAVGTTSLRVLETVSRLDLEGRGGDELNFPTDADPVPEFAGVARRDTEGTWAVHGETRLFIAPPDRITAADALITNFHLPGSSLLMLVAAFVGGAAWRKLYAHAVAGGFRFYSYGDAMLIGAGGARP